MIKNTLFLRRKQKLKIIELNSSGTDKQKNHSHTAEDKTQNELKTLSKGMNVLNLVED